MDEDLVLTYLRRKLKSNLDEAVKEAGRSSWIMSRFRCLEKQILEKSSACGCGIPVELQHLLYDVMEALSECRVFSYERPTAKSAVSGKGFFYLTHVLHHLVSEFLFKRMMSKRLSNIEEKLGSLSPADANADADAPQPQTKPISDHWDIIGFEEEVVQIEKWLTPSSADTFREIAIVGEWGCGKTALAQKVLATPKIKEEFSPLIWVCLSGTMPEQEEEEEEARERVVKCIKEKIGQEVWDELNGKRYLMVLDDASWHWKGGLGLDLPKGGGGALILTTRRDNDLGHNHVIPLKPQLSDEICWQIFSKAAHLQKKLHPAEPLLSTIRNDVMKNSKGRALVVKTLGTTIPDLLLQTSYWIRARDLNITWGNDTRYWRWTNLPPPQEMEEVAELMDVCWLQIQGSLELHKFLSNKSYSAYLVFKLKERNNLTMKMKAGVRIVSNPAGSEHDEDTHRSYVYIGRVEEGDRFPQPHAGGTEWMEIRLGDFFSDIRDHGKWVKAILLEDADQHWKSGLIVKGISFRLNHNFNGDHQAQLAPIVT